MAFYETTFIVRQDVSTAQVETLTKEYQDIVKKNGGKVVRVENWGLRQLAYLVNKNRKGHYVMLCIDGGAPAINELDRQFRLSEDVIRSMTIKVDAISEEPSVLVPKAA